MRLQVPTAARGGSPAVAALRAHPAQPGSGARRPCGLADPHLPGKPPLAARQPGSACCNWLAGGLAGHVQEAACFPAGYRMLSTLELASCMHARARIPPCCLVGKHACLADRPLGFHDKFPRQVLRQWQGCGHAQHNAGKMCDCLICWRVWLIVWRLWARGQERPVPCCMPAWLYCSWHDDTACVRPFQCDVGMLACRHGPDKC